VQGGFEEGAAGVCSGGELGFECVANGHEFVNFGDDKPSFMEPRVVFSPKAHTGQNRRCCELAGMESYAAAS